ncbi:hypothetical protein MXB_5094 [Myxobolus squamalis]|nr:hypothetical protein MXB_5094 [Myxobolus squamalis]
MKDCDKDKNLYLESFNFELHKNYFQNHLSTLISQYEELDSSRIMVLFFSLCSLEICYGENFDDFIAKNRNQIIDWIYSPVNQLDIAHVTCTHVAILSLIILKDDLRNLDRFSILKTLSCLQLPDGSFKSQTSCSESDARFFYCTCVICFLLNGWHYINVDKLLIYIISCQNYDGGFGCKPGLESHGIPSYPKIYVVQLFAQ